MKNTPNVPSKPDTRPRWKYFLPAAGIILLAGTIFFELAGDVWLKEGFSWDPSIMLFFGSLRSSLGIAVMHAVTTTASGWIALPVIASVAWLVHKGERKQALTLAIGFLVAILFNTGLKTIFARPRPHIIPPLTVEHTKSFPSGHTLSAVVFYGYLAVCAWRGRHRAVAFLLTLWSVLVGLSRIYLGAHYPSDVLASFTLGLIFILFMLGFLELSYQKHRHGP